MESRFCSKCGAPLNPGAKFCAKCGAAVINRADIPEPAMTGQPVQTPQQIPDTVTQESFVQPQMNVEPAAENRKSKKKKWVILSIILAAVLVMVVIPGTIALIIRSQIRKHSVPVPPTSFAQTAEAERDDEEEEEETAAVDANFPAGDYSGEVDEDGADSDGMKLPVAGPGEKVYIGYGELEGIGLTKMALVLSEDRQSVHDIVILLDGISSPLGGYNVMFSNMQTSTTTEYDLPATDETLGQSTIKDMHMEGDYIYVRLDYVFTNISFGTSSQDQLIPLGETEIWLREAG